MHTLNMYVESCRYITQNGVGDMYIILRLPHLLHYESKFESDETVMCVLHSLYTVSHKRTTLS